MATHLASELLITEIHQKNAADDHSAADNMVRANSHLYLPFSVMVSVAVEDADADKGTDKKRNKASRNGRVMLRCNLGHLGSFLICCEDCLYVVEAPDEDSTNAHNPLSNMVTRSTHIRK